MRHLMTFSHPLELVKKTAHSVFIALFVLIFATPGLAQAPQTGASDWVITEQTAVRLISATDKVNQNQQQFGLQFKLKKGWKIYWRSPGDAGFPPKPDWSASKNIKSVDMSWPIPERFSVLGLETLGYKNEVVFPLSVRIKNPNESTTLATTVNYLTCAEICIPYTTNLNLTLAAGPSATTDMAILIKQYQDRVPTQNDDFKITKATTQQTVKDGENVSFLSLTARSKTAFTAPDVFIEGPPEFAFSKPTISVNANGTEAVLNIEVYGAETSILGQSFIVTLKDQEQISETAIRILETKTPYKSSAPITRPDTETDTTSASKKISPSLLIIILFAFIGGMILNLMPCVLPVLSIKLLSVVKSGGLDAKRVRYGFIASTLGILSAFLILAGILIALKSIGLTIGWGIQFQQPWFLITMILVITLFACNMVGIFEISLPTWISSRINHSDHSTRLGGHFFQGMLATVLATPCSAPFLGTAVGFALARGPFEILAIFLGVGIGLAVPYLLIAAFPGAVRHIPKPGPWMVRLKQVLALALAATVLWLLSILASNIGLETAVASGTLALLIIVSLIVFKYRHKDRISRPGWAITIVLSALALSTPSLLGQSVSAKPESHAAKQKLVNWVAWDQQAIPELVKQGKTVFVDVTAEWCITCQINKNFILYRGQSLELLNQKNVIAMTADWTKPDQKISDYLSSFERYGIPFNIVYGPKEPDGVILPELLTQNAVTQAFAKASNQALAEK